MKLRRLSALLPVLLAVIFSLSAPASRAQSQPQIAPAPKYEYDVVSIKILGPDEGPATWGIGYTPDGLTAKGVRMFWLFRNAYDVPRLQIVGEQSWFEDTRFSIEARLDPATAAELHKLSPDHLRVARQQMLQAVLADRFGLTFHRETRELPAYFLTVAKGGPKLQEAKSEFVGKLDQNDMYGQRFSDFVTLSYDGQSVLVGQAATMTTLATFLSQWALNLSGEKALPVVDQTRLTGRYDFSVRFSTDNVFLSAPSMDSPGAAPPMSMPNAGGPNIFKALQDVLGLKLETGKGPVPVIVIDHITKPSAN